MHISTFFAPFFTENQWKNSVGVGGWWFKLKREEGEEGGEKTEVEKGGSQCGNWGHPLIETLRNGPK